MLVSCAFVLLFLGVLSAEADAANIDTKYFCSFIYKRPAIFDSVFSFSPSMRFDKGVSRLCYVTARAGCLFHPSTWLDLGLYYRYVDQIATDNKWASDNRIEFEITPKIVLDFLDPDELKAMAANASGITGTSDFSRDEFIKELEDDDIFVASSKKALRFILLDMRAEVEYWNLDLQDTSKVNPVLKLQPGASWLYDYGTIYVADEVLHSIKYNEWFSNWARIGLIRPFYGLKLDTYYIYESLRTIPNTPEWDHANIFGTTLSYSEM